MKVLKFGGSSLKDVASIKTVARIISSTKELRVVVFSAFAGVTDRLSNFLVECQRQGAEDRIRKFISQLKNEHLSLLEKSVPAKGERQTVYNLLTNSFNRLERFLYGVSYVEEISPRSRDLILSFGERFAVAIMSAALGRFGIRNRPFEADTIGMITDGDFGNATVILPVATKNLRRLFLPLLKSDVTPLVTGFFGCDSESRTTTFGRGGSDYSASVIAYALDARQLEIWKDVDGFLSVSPEIVQDRSQSRLSRRGTYAGKASRLLDVLSYDEAAELAYFGAEILHPRMVEPAMLKDIPIIIRNTFNPAKKGTAIIKKGYETKGVVKSIAYDQNIAVLKIHGAGVGYKLGALHDIVSHISKSGINIKSVITSQTCINLLLAKEDLDLAYQALHKAHIRVIEHLEKVKDIALIGIVGEGLVKTKGLAARVFGAVATAAVNVEMISAGASSVAYYFIIKEKGDALTRAIKAIHSEFFK
ncbi:MAG: aspartate kinase [Planctomycetes bacterium]|nr:aspartate kinase [Planctomycetota bacterium]